MRAYRPIATTWYVRTAGSLGRRTTKVAEVPGAEAAPAARSRGRAPHPRAGDAPSSAGDLGGRAGQHRLAPLGLRRQDDPPRRDLPHVGGDRLAGVDDPGEADLEGLETRGVVPAPGAQDRTAGEAEGAEPVQDRPLVAGHAGELGVGVQRVHVAREPVEQRLLGPRRHGDRLVGRPVRRHVARAARATLAAEAALAAREDARGVPEEETALLVDALGLDEHE